jgi:hypothetical protein
MVSGSFFAPSRPAAASVTGLAPVVNPTFSGQVEVGTGSSAAPALNPVGDPDTGLFFPAANTVALTAAGTERLRVGSDGSVSLSAAPGAESFRAVPVVGAVNRYDIQGGTTGNGTLLAANGTDPAISAFYATKGTGNHLFYTGGTLLSGAAVQVAIENVASANRYLTFQGANGGTPTIGTSAGALALSPTQTIVASTTATPAGGSTGVGLALGTTPNLGLFFGSGVPTLSAAQGSLYLRTNGDGVTGFYTNTNGANGWASAAGSLVAQGAHTLCLLGPAFVPRTTNGPGDYSAETSTHRITVSGLAFDPVTTEYAQIALAMPGSWDRGTLRFEVLWMAAGGSGGVAWALRAVAIGNDDPLDAAFGTAVTVTQTLTAANEVNQTAQSAALTVAGSPASKDMVVLEIYRDVVNAADTLAVDAVLLAVRLYMTINAATD